MMKKLVPPVVIALLFALFWFSGAYDYLNPAEIVDRKEQFQQAVNQNPFLAVLIFSMIYTSVVALSLPFASLLTMTAGFLFGLVTGTFIVVASATLGATIIFTVAKTSMGQVLKEKAGKLYQKIEADMRENAVGYLLFLRLVPLFPFFLVNIVPAFFNIKTKTYIWTTAFGIFPGTLIYVNVGRSLGQVDNPADLVSGDLVLSMGLLGCVALVPVIYKKWKGYVRVKS